MQTVARSSWHELPVSKVAELLETDLVSGLSAAEAKSRLKQYGPNKVTEKPGTPPWKRFLLQFHQPLIYILLVASGLTLALGEFVDGSVIFGVVFILRIYRLHPGNKGRRCDPGAIENARRRSNSTPRPAQTTSSIH